MTSVTGIPIVINIVAVQQSVTGTTNTVYNDCAHFYRGYVTRRRYNTFNYTRMSSTYSKNVAANYKSPHWHLEEGTALMPRMTIWIDVMLVKGAKEGVFAFIYLGLQTWTAYKYRTKRKWNKNLLSPRKPEVLNDDLLPMEEGDTSDSQDINCCCSLAFKATG
uniref:Uncharacterized protein n=1 Tax=Glossina palpalis gambiensis TaxID=67801 RepID=A0A1B0AX74_9MUSC